MPHITKPQIFILLLLVTFASIGAMAISPALPAIADQFGIPDADTQILITIYMFGFAIGQLFYGPLSNRYGRKPFIFFGILISALCALLGLVSAFLNFFPLMVMSRFLMALSGSSCLKMSYNMIADLLKPSDLTKMISYFMLAFAIAPPVGIAIGGLLTQIWGWESVFIFLFAYSFIILFLSLELPETLPHKDLNALRIPCMVNGFKQTLMDKHLLLSSILMGCGTSVIYLFATEAPFISMHIIGLTPNTYGWLTMLVNLGMVAAGITGACLAKKISELRVVFFGSMIFLFASVAYLALFSFNLVNLWTLFLPMPFILMGASLAFTNSSSIGLSHAKDKSYASSVMSFINLIFTVLLIYILSRFSAQKVSVMPTMLLIVALLVLTLWWGLKRVVAIAKE